MVWIISRIALGQGKWHGDENPLILSFPVFRRGRDFVKRLPENLMTTLFLRKLVRKQKIRRRWVSMDFVVHVVLPRTRPPRAFSEIKKSGPERSCTTVPGIPHQGPRNLHTKTLSPRVPFAFRTKFAKLYDFPKVWTNVLGKTQLEEENCLFGSALYATAPLQLRNVSGGPHSNIYK